MERKEYKTEPLECWEEAKYLRNKYYEDYLKAEERGGIRVSGSSITYWSVVAGLGEDVCILTGEPYGATVAFHSDFSAKCLEAVERAGIARDLCAYMRNYWGSIILDKYILADGTVIEGWPKADILFSGHFCCGHAKWYQFARELEGGIPLRAHDIPVHALCTEVNEKRLDYIVQQLMEAISWMEKITGRRYDDELLIEAVQNECRVSSLWGETCMYQKTIPAPLDEKSMFSLYVMNQLCPYKREVVNFYERLRDEVKDRVKRGIAAVPGERFRIMMTDTQPPWAFLKVWRYLEREYGVVSIGSIYSLGLQFEWEVDEKGNLVPAKTPQERGIKITNREEALRAYVDFKLKNLCVMTFYGILTRIELMKKMMQQWNADAVIIHLNRGCEGTAIGQTELRLALVEENIPVMTFEGNMADPRDFDVARTVSRIDSFLEGLGLKKLGK